jgi:hypothetical protein
MDTLVITSSRPFSLQDIGSAVGERLRVEDTAGGGLAVLGSDSRVYMHVDPSGSGDGRFRLLLDYSDVDLAKAVLDAFADDPEITVDNDFGVVLSGKEFVARARADPGWDWRQACA